MPKKRGQDRERVEVGDALDRPAIAQQQSVHVGPLDNGARDAGVQPELDEQEVTLSAPAVNVRAQVRKAAPDASEVRLRSVDPDHGSRERLQQHNIRVKEFRQALW
ncbi:hypothetical protein A5747_21585 [Mycobacterium sp. IS-836]|nr:hypothetical protein A5747_21585 [Mycobacterium sp. IS-836]